MQTIRKGKAKSCVCSYGKYSHTWIFKYYGFLLDTVNSFLTTDIPYRVLPLPIGISFYTFQAISYVIDIYRKDAKPQKNILYFALYISMFPQLIAGPIVRYADIEEQLKMRKVTLRKLGQGSMYFIIGLAKKVIIANSTGAVFEEVAAMSTGSLSVLTAWVGVFSYAFQIYFDFSGYSDMAIGLGKCSDLNLRKILTIRMYRKAQRNFGEGGIFLLERGLESMYIFLSAAIDVRFREIYLT